MKTATGTATTRRGRPPRYLLSGIAVCGVCGASLRVGSQNSGVPEGAARYRVYECAGTPGGPGFHVSISQEHLDQIVTDAVLERVGDAGFETPRALDDDPDGTERRALHLEIKSHRVWLDTVWKEARRRDREHVAIAQERIVLPKIEEAQARIDRLDQLDPEIDGLRTTGSPQHTWEQLSLDQRRRIIQAVMTVRINPVPADERGRRGVDANARRVDVSWLATSRTEHDSADDERSA